jgi:ferrous iron transport protein A
MMLTQLRTGDIAKIIAVDGGHHLQHKLSLRGLAEGSIVRVISNIGPVTVEVDRNVVSIGRGMADRIRVMSV